MANKKIRGRSAIRLDEDSLTVASDVQGPSNSGSSRKRGEDVRVRIMNAALDYFGAFGFEGSTTRAIAERADVSHSLVIYHFGTKEKLWIATINFAISDYVEGIRELSKDIDKSPADQVLRRLIDMFVRVHAQRPQIHRLMTMEGNQSSARFDWLLDNFLRDNFKLWRDLIRRGQDEGTVRTCDPARLYYMVIGAGGTPFSLPLEYSTLTGRDIFSEAEILRNIAFIYEIVFIKKSK